MLSRRFLLAALPASAAVSGAQAAPDSFADFLAALRNDARHAGIATATLDRALAGLTPNQKVLQRERHQPGIHPDLGAVPQPAADRKAHR